MLQAASAGSMLTALAAGKVPGVHGVGGHVKVENPRYHNVIHDSYFEAAKQIGLPHNPDFNNWNHSQVSSSGEGLCSLVMHAQAACTEALCPMQVPGFGYKYVAVDFQHKANAWGAEQEGYGEFQVYHDNGERADMYRQYVKPAERRENLTLLKRVWLELCASCLHTAVALRYSCCEQGSASTTRAEQLQCMLGMLCVTEG